MSLVSKKPDTLLYIKVTINSDVFGYLALLKISGFSFFRYTDLRIYTIIGKKEVDPMRYSMEVLGMTCDDCVATVTKALKDVGAESVVVSLMRAKAHFAFDGDTKKLIEAVKRSGYRVGSIVALEGQQDDGTKNKKWLRYDLVIIGSGSAAFAAAIRARELGASVAMVERNRVGGTCVNIGCVPSKALIKAGEYYTSILKSKFSGISATGANLDLNKVVEDKNRLISQLQKEKYLDLIDTYGFDLYKGHAKFVNQNTVEINDLILEGEKIIIAVGARPAIPPIQGIESIGYLTSTSALSLTDVPQSMAVIGANAIGLELGQYFAHLGSKVYLLEMMDRIAPFEEPEISSRLHEILTAEGLNIITAATVVRVSKDQDKVSIVYEQAGEKNSLTVDKLLIAAGRRANTDDMNADVAAVSLDRRGFVIVDEYLMTTAQNVYAAGDAAGLPQYVYVAARSGKIAAENALLGNSKKIDLTSVPRVIFTTPPVAAVGLSENKAKTLGYSLGTATLESSAIPRALVDRETNGLMKLIYDESSRKLLGVHAVMENAAEVMYSATLAIQLGATIDDLIDSYAPYLTMAEGLRLAAQASETDVAMLSCCAG